MTATVALHPSNIFAYKESSAVSEASVKLESLLRLVRRHYLEPASRLSIEATYQELVSTFEDCSMPNWDGYGAAAISQASLYNALRFLDLLPPSLPSPEVTPESDGTVGLEWYKGKDWLFSIDIGGDGKITYAGMFGEGVQSHGTERFDDSIPQTILSNIRRIYESPSLGQ
ncbi:MAG: hypothetical protein GKR94_32225 [Gammaproteobacteria bacterium]|nr:hypothetical protein [Gammaproteobacteria bacterium]